MAQRLAAALAAQTRPGHAGNVYVERPLHVYVAAVAPWQGGPVQNAVRHHAVQSTIEFLHDVAQAYMHDRWRRFSCFQKLAQPLAAQLSDT